MEVNNNIIDWPITSASTCISNINLFYIHLPDEYSLMSQERKKNQIQVTHKNIILT